MRLRFSTVFLLICVVLLNIGVTAYISQTIVANSPDPIDYSSEIRELRTELRTLTQQLELLTEFVESKHGLINNLNQDKTNQSDVLIQEREVVIGVIPATSQKYSYYVPYVTEIIEPAVNQMSWDIGSDLSFRFKVLDAEGQAARHLEHVQWLNSIGVNLIIGGMWSSQACASLSYCNYNDILLFSPSSSSPLPAIEGDNLFRLCPIDFKVSKVMAKMFQSKGVEAIVVIQRGDSWADGIYEDLEDDFNEIGGVITSRIRYPGETTEFSEYLEVAEAAALETVEDYGWNNVAIELVSFAEAINVVGILEDYPTLYNLTWFGSEGTVNIHQILDEAPEQSAHVKLYSMQLVLPDTLESQSLSSKFDDVSGMTLDYYDACSYDIAMIMGRAVIEADSIDTNLVKAKIQEICEDYRGVTGVCELDIADDRVTSNYGINSYCIEDGKFEFRLVGLYHDTGELTWYED